MNKKERKLTFGLKKKKIKYEGKLERIQIRKV
jgi:hypothetical protein